MEEEEDEVSMDTGTEQKDAGAEGVSPLQATALNDQFQAAASVEEFRIQQGLIIFTSGTFAALEDGSNPRLEPAKDLYVGENSSSASLSPTVGIMRTKSPKQPSS
jgi:hypothetical protein